jgi:hypothetical protein
MKRLLILTLFAFSPACGDDGADGNDHDAADGEGCEHLQEGPEVAVTATATAAGAPSVDDDHMRYDITLVAISGGQGGVVKFAAAAAGTHVIFLGADVPLFITDAAGAPVAITESSSSSEACADIKGKHVVDLEVGTYNLTLGPTASTSVSMVVEPLGE